MNEKPSVFSKMLAGAWLALFLTACATAPLDFPRERSEAYGDTSGTALAMEVAEWTARHPGKSGFYPLTEGLDALGVRLALIDLAERSIDAQYFLMKPDSAGYLFAEKLMEAADRGVRVRLLLDDVFTTVGDESFLLLNQHPNIELRLFNPVGRRGLYALNFLGNFRLANRRMHNKSFTVDNQVSVVGGRNIADEYFELKEELEFRDFDMLASGPVVLDISAVFDRFWNHELSVPMEAFEGDQPGPSLESVRAAIDASAREAGETIYGRALASPLMQDINDDRLALYPGTARVISDDPQKLLQRKSTEQQVLVNELADVVREAGMEVVVVTPYFIPGESGVAFWRDAVNRGVRVVILTNSLATNNHTPVHGAYARYRRDLIEAGVELYEARLDASKTPVSDHRQAYDTLTLHSKAVVVDRHHVFVGSLNLDPRSIDINTEGGVLIESADLAGRLAGEFFPTLPSFAYRVTLDEDGELAWTCEIDGRPVTETSEPQAGAWLRFKAWLFRLFPEGQL